MRVADRAGGVRGRWAGAGGDGRAVLVPFMLPGEWAELDQDKRPDRDRGAVVRKGRAGVPAFWAVWWVPVPACDLSASDLVESRHPERDTGACGAPEPAEDRGSCVGAVGIPEPDSAAGGGWAGLGITCGRRMSFCLSQSARSRLRCFGGRRRRWCHWGRVARCAGSG